MMPLTRRALQWKQIIHLQALHEAADLLASKETHEVILKREIETRGARITLASRATAQLIVDTPGFMPLRTDDMQTTQDLDTLHIIEVLEEVLHLSLVDAVLPGVNLEQSLAAILHGHVEGIGIASAAKNTIDRGDDLLGESRRRA